MTERRKLIEITIDAGTALSAWVDASGYDIVGFYLPANWTATGGGNTFQAKRHDDDTVARNVWGPSGEIKTGSGSASRFLQIDRNSLKGHALLRMRSGTAAAAVAQVTARTVYALAVEAG